MKVEVELLGQLRSLAGKQRTTVQLDSQQPRKPTLTTVIRSLKDEFGSELEGSIVDLKSEHPCLKALVLKNNVEVGSLKKLETEVKEGDRLVIIPVTHGG